LHISNIHAGAGQTVHEDTDLKETLCSGTPSMHHPLRNTLPIKLCELLNQVIVL
jgi:hypothetical protein